MRACNVSCRKKTQLLGRSLFFCGYERMWVEGGYSLESTWLNGLENMTICDECNGLSDVSFDMCIFRATGHRGYVVSKNKNSWEVQTNTKRLPTILTRMTLKKHCSLAMLITFLAFLVHLKNHPIEKENQLPNLHFLGSMLTGGWTNPFQKYASVKLDPSYPMDRGENKTSLSCHHRSIHLFWVQAMFVFQDVASLIRV